MLLKDAIAHLDGIEAIGGNLSIPIEGISYDSRKVRRGHLFVAIKGEKVDGGRFIQDAISHGAAAVASENAVESHGQVTILKVTDARRFLAQTSILYFGEPSSKLKLTAITGTNGKTTSSYLMESIYGKAGLPSCLLGTIGIKINGKPFPTIHTTPESVDLMSFLQQAVTEGCTHGVLEVSSHALALKRVFGAKFAVAVFTNLTPDHLDFHKDMESYYLAKRLLFMPENQNNIQAAVINTDDPYGRRLLTEIRYATLTYGFNPTADVRVLKIGYRSDGTDLQIATPKGEMHFSSPLVGLPNIYNIMAVVGAALALAIDAPTIREGIESLRSVPGRMESINAGQPFAVIVDYAHTPDALEKLLETVANLPHKSLITVFGCGGDRDRTKRPVMGEIATRISDCVIATSDNPRTEDPIKILAEIEAGLQKGHASYTLVPNRRDAIAKALAMAGAGDVVVIAGKGHETYQTIGTQSLPFDDRLVAQELILKLLNSDGVENKGEFTQ
ncbi:MAG: UDP-N-acetylmuramyl-tripeptide synthetase [Acidobacteria bacterium]|nr:UDP-N-acetylmuramyl-tripeptide synthetase [Acidobacteriota bacterium]